MGKTTLNKSDEEEIVRLYTIDNMGMEGLCEKYKIAKLRLKKILTSNDVIIRGKGNIVKHTGTHEKEDYSGIVLVCNKTGNVFVDVENFSGSITTHLKQTYEGIQIPTYYERKLFFKKNGIFWYDQFFTRKGKEVKETIKCVKCDWVTSDINNLSGTLTKHLWEDHRLIPEDVLENYPNLWKTLRGDIERTESLKNGGESVICLECGEYYKILSAKHLESHGLTSKTYKEKWGDVTTVSKNLSTKFSEITTETNKHMKPTFISKNEILIGEFIESLGFEIIRNNRSIIGKEMDIYIPSKNIGIEYNGLYFHREKYGKGKDYHISKTKIAEENGIKLLQIFSDEWVNNTDIVKNRLKTILNVVDKKIYARNCVIKEVSSNIKNEFLLKTHIQGSDNSSIRYGAYIGDVLVGVMTFGNLRRSTGSRKELGTYELLRFSNNNVIGLASKFIKRFINDYKPNKIVSFADRRWSPIGIDTVYTKIGFRFVGETKPNYWYSYDFHNREARFKYRKDVLIKGGYDPLKSESQIMSERGFDRIWDCGSFKYEMIINE